MLAARNLSSSRVMKITTGSVGLAAIRRSRLMPSRAPSDRSRTMTSYLCLAIRLLASSNEPALSVVKPNAVIARVTIRHWTGSSSTTRRRRTALICVSTAPPGRRADWPGSIAAGHEEAVNQSNRLNQEGQGFAPDPTRGLRPLDTRQGRSPWSPSLGWGGGGAYPDLARSGSAPPPPQPNGWIAKAPPLLGGPGGESPLGGFPGRELTVLRSLDCPGGPFRMVAAAWLAVSALVRSAAVVQPGSGAVAGDEGRGWRAANLVSRDCAGRLLHRRLGDNARELSEEGVRGRNVAVAGEGRADAQCKHRGRGKDDGLHGLSPLFAPATGRGHWSQAIASGKVSDVVPSCDGREIDLLPGQNNPAFLEVISA